MTKEVSAPIFSTNRNNVTIAECDCFLIKAKAPGWDCPMYMRTVETWTSETARAAIFADYDAAVDMVQELRLRPPSGVAACVFESANLVIEAVPLLGQLHRDRTSSGLRRK